MSDLTSTLSSILKQHDAHLGQGRTSSSDVSDEFLKEAYRIVHSPPASSLAHNPTH
jgi:hypothetical protein